MITFELLKNFNLYFLFDRRHHQLSRLPGITRSLQTLLLLCCLIQPLFRAGGMEALDKSLTAALLGGDVLLGDRGPSQLVSMWCVSV